tara:strand:+ start:17605 stop:19869 length:2265 start_codon:yes stop_codon:yes gene_type:complete
MSAPLPRSVLRYFNIDGVSSSGKHKVSKAEFIQLLERMMEATGAGVSRATKALLDAVTPEADDYPLGLVTNDPVLANNGVYTWDGADWARDRAFPDTMSVLTELGGTANAITASTLPGIDPSEVVALVLQPIANSTAGVTLSVNGGAAKPVMDSDGTVLAAGGLTAGRITMLIDNGDEYRLLVPVDAAGAAASAAASASAANTDADRAEAARDIALGAQPAVFTASLSTLAQLDPDDTNHAYVENSNAAGQFKWDGSDLSSDVDGMDIVAPGAGNPGGLATDGTEGAWVRIDPVVPSAPRLASSRSEMASFDTSKVTTAFLSESGRTPGSFQWSSGDLSAEVAIDTAEVVYVAPTSQDGSSGAWVRDLNNNEISPLMAGAVVTSHDDFAAMDNGDQTTLMTANSAAVDACGLLMRDLGFAIKGPGLEAPIYVNDTFNWMRDDIDKPWFHSIKDLWLDWRESGLTSGAALSLGSTGLSEFPDKGKLTLHDVRLYGPETSNPASAGSVSTTMDGLVIEYGPGLDIVNAGAMRFRRGNTYYFCFPGVLTRPFGEQNGTGFFMRSSVNNVEIINPQAKECMFSFVIQFSNNRIENQVWTTPRAEDSLVGFVLDCTSLTGGADRIRNLKILDPWFSGIEYDTMRVCRSWVESDPSDAGTPNTDRMINLTIDGGNWAPKGGAWTSTRAAIRSHGSGQTACMGINAVLPVEDTANALQGTFIGGQVRFVGTAHGSTGAMQYQNKLVTFNVSGSRTTQYTGS